MASLKEMKVNEYLDALASDSKIPGGGSASALTGSLAASLASMVSSLVHAKVDDPALKLDMKNYVQRAGHLRLMLEACIDEDARMFDLLMDAYNLPKDLEGRTERLQRALKNAAAIPMRIATLSCRVIDLCDELYPQVKGLKISDCAICAMLAWTAVMGASVSIKINTYMIRDRDYASSVNKQMDDLELKYRPIATNIYYNVTEKITR